MSHALRALFCAALMCALAAPCLAKSSPWDGTWKLNEAKSKMTGDTFTIKEANGMYIHEAGGFTDKYACDGKDYPGALDRTVSCTKSGDSYDTTYKLNGKTIGTTHHVISADGKTMQASSVSNRPDGSTEKDDTTYERVGAGQGMVGTWKDVKTSSNAASSLILKLNGNVLHCEYPEFKGVAETQMDGTPGALTGPMIPAGATISTKPEGARKLRMITALNGKAASEDVLTLSADGKTITDLSWSTDKPSEKQTFVYEKE